MKVTPNEEQQKAIYHQGGVLLEAGAGSGKTFVLTVHIVYILDLKIKEFLSLENISKEDFAFRNFISTEMSKVVMTTFTKKAAGEIKTRIVKRFHEAQMSYEYNLPYNPWDIIISLIDKMYIGTIHGFCKKLISEGLILTVDPEAPMIQTEELTSIVSKIVENYLGFEVDEDDEFFEKLLYQKESIIANSVKILGDPLLRRTWENLEKNAYSKDNANDLMKDILDLNLDLDLLYSPPNLSNVSDKEHEKGWFKIAKYFSLNILSLNPTLEEIVNLYNGYLGLEVKQFRIPKTIDEEHIEYCESIKSFRDFIKKHIKDFEAYLENFDDYVKPWFIQQAKAFKYVLKNYAKENVITFSDLEYYVQVALDDPKVQGLVRSRYEYFIVDEFQDTSNVQYDILKKLVNNDFTKLFCVGDIKQAIYGFRGGEVGVFLDCKEKIPMPLNLKSNYRSLGNIVHFNNVFFEYIFKLGNEFEGVDKFSVPVEFQTILEAKEGIGEFYNTNIKLENLELEENKLSTAQVNYIEALGIFDNIKKILEKKPDIESMAILYKKMAPSLNLIDLLMKNKIGFTAQVKISYGDDPILGIFLELIKSLFNKNKNSKIFRDKIINSYLILLGLSKRKNLEILFNEFESDIRYFSIKEAYKKLFFNLGISNANAKTNYSLIDILIDLVHGDLEDLVGLISNESDETYSIDFQYGENSHKVQIMSAHASKGLEFSHVICGGMYTNGRPNPSREDMGTMPGAFKWYKGIKKSDNLSTPEFLFEKSLSKQKDFSESKRLFYVAYTRAVESIGLVSLDFGSELKASNHKNSWINGIGNFQGEVFEKALFLNSWVNSLSYELDITDLYDEQYLERKEFSIPLFHTDPLGVKEKINLRSKLMFLPEMSVTKMALIVECPKKFYFQNILKINDPHEILDENDKHHEDVSGDFEDGNIMRNTSMRGTQIHEGIENGIENNFETESTDPVIVKVVEELKIINEDYELFSEVQMKFNIFDFTVNGIPDLYLIPRKEGGEFQIWDFKTGRSNEEKNKKYFFQLYAYAQALYSESIVSKDSLINLVIYYVDEAKKEVIETSFEDTQNYLWGKFQLLNSFDQCLNENCYFCR